MKKELEKRRFQYRKILKKDPILCEISDYLYESSESQDDAQTLVSYYVMAPVMFRFVLWVLKKAVELGRERLYFLARDGYSMYKVARVICRETGILLECRYLYSSRFAWRSADFCLLGKESLSYICLGGIDVTFQKVMRRAGLTQEEAVHIAGELGFLNRFTEVLSYSEVKDLAPVLRESQTFMDILISRAENRYPSVCGYLEQEGLLEKVPYAIVDSGWTGSMQKTLVHILSSMGQQSNMHGFYFGLYELPTDVDHTLYHSWYFDSRDIYRKVYFYNSLFECIFSSPEGMTVGYEYTGKKYVPKLEHTYNPNHERIQRSTKYLEQYAETILRKYPDYFIRNDLDFRKITAELFHFFMGQPTLFEAEEYGKYIFCDDVVGEDKQTVAAELSQTEIKDNHLLHKSLHLLMNKSKPVRESAWMAGSTVLLSPKRRNSLRKHAVYRYVLYFRKTWR